MLGWFKKNKEKDSTPLVQEDSTTELSEETEEKFEQPIEETQPEILKNDEEEDDEFYGTGIFGGGYDDDDDDEEEEEEEHDETPQVSEPLKERSSETIEEEEDVTPTASTPLDSLQETEEQVEVAPVELFSERPEAPITLETLPEDEITDSDASIGAEFLSGLELYEEPEPDDGAVTETTAVHDPTATQTKPTEGRATSFFRRLADKLSRTRDSFINQMDRLFLGKKEIDADLLDDLEELLITSDLGVATTSEIIEHARRKISRNELSDPQALKGLFKEKLRTYIVDATKPAELVMPESGPFVIMVIGVNGVGKTTTIGKITHKFIASGQSVLLVAADTFRAAAVSQLQIWGKRNNVEVVSGKEGIDPSSVVYDAMDRAKEKNYDVVLVDTAGRLHTQTNLMEELKKIKRVMGKRLEGAPHEVLLVLDATTGQNGISQARLFNEAVGVTGLTLTKLDGTAKGGIVANISRDLNIPIRFIGIGEQIDDLRDFDPDEFIEALFHESDAS